MTAKQNDTKSSNAVNVRAIERDIQKAMLQLILKEEFFGALALNLRIEVSTRVPTLGTDGRSLVVNPAYWAALSAKEKPACVAHEAMHCALGHPWRRESRDPQRWNIAADVRVNDYVDKMQWCSLPAGIIRDTSGKYDGWTEERIYADVDDSNDACNGDHGDGDQDGDAQSGDAQSGDGAPCTCGKGGCQVMDPGPPEDGDASDGADKRDAQQVARDWQETTRKAVEACKARGTLPGSMTDFDLSADAPRIDSRALLHRFIQATSTCDYTWRQPSKRYMSRGLYMPRVHSERVGWIVWAIDTSGSVGDALLNRMLSEVAAATRTVDCERITLLLIDTQVNQVIELQTGDALPRIRTRRGGTYFGPAFKWIDDQGGDEPAALIYLTDLECTHDDYTDPAYPVLWIVPADTCRPYAQQPTHGEVLPWIEG